MKNRKGRGKKTCSVMVDTTPNTPRCTLAAFKSGSPTANARTVANPSAAVAGVTSVMATTYSCKAPPLPHSELPLTLLAVTPPSVTPSNIGAVVSAMPSAAMPSIN